MVRALHEAGLEVVLDVVYNHTCEGGPGGPTLSWRGLDAATYYRLDAHGGYVDTTGCGNSLDFREARVVQMTMDSLRYWVEEMHVDGFRFDLAPTVARGHEGFDGEHPFLVAARIDPVLGGVKLIAEPWDLGSTRLADGPVPGTLRRVERPVPRRRPRVLAGRWPAGGARRAGGGRAGPRDPARRVGGRLPRPSRAARVGELRLRARRLHARRSGVVRPQAQRGERRGQSGRGDREPFVEPRRGRAHATIPSSWATGAAMPATCWAPCCWRPASP